ncbi:MAG: sugar ABC transporter permease [Bacilli bacterium]|nr:sugar ABC transporter permease [Bacilli bacterium]
MYLRRKQKSEALKGKIKKNVLAWAIILPSILLFVFFVWYPILFNIGLSFFKDNTFSEFVWFENYKAIFEDIKFITALKNTFLYIFWSLIIGFLVPLFIGFLLSETVHARIFIKRNGVS